MVRYADNFPVDEKDLLNTICQYKCDVYGMLMRIDESKAESARKMFNNKVEGFDHKFFANNKRAIEKHNQELFNKTISTFTAFVESNRNKTDTKTRVEIKYQKQQAINHYIKFGISDMSDYIVKLTNQLNEVEGNLLETKINKINEDFQNIRLENITLTGKCQFYEKTIEEQKLVSERLLNETKEIYEKNNKINQNNFDSSISNLNDKIERLTKENDQYQQRIKRMEEIELQKKGRSTEKVNLNNDILNTLYDLRHIASENIEDRVRILAEKEVLVLEKDFNESKNNMKERYEEQLKQTKNTYEEEIKDLKNELHRVKGSFNNFKVEMLRKETEIKLMQQRLSIEQGNKETQMEFSKILCNVS